MSRIGSSVNDGRDWFTTVCVIVGVATAIYISWQFATGGAEAARMAALLAAEASEVKPPSAASLVTRDNGWEPHFAFFSESYNTDLTETEILKYHSAELERLHWTPGREWPNQSSTGKALSYHKRGREFTLYFGSANAGWRYATAITWRR